MSEQPTDTMQDEQNERMPLGRGGGGVGSEVRISLVQVLHQNEEVKSAGQHLQGGISS